MTVLDDIVAKRRKDIAELKKRLSTTRLKNIAIKQAEGQTRRSFKKSLNQHGINIIGELKKASPSGGILREDFQPLRLAALYQICGVKAISVLTEPHYFKGRTSYLKTVRQVTSVPLLRKDFIVDKYQIYETSVLEADAFLLIASLLSEKEITEFSELGKSLGMDALVEVHSDEDLKKALNANAEIIGINNRNLKTLEVDTMAAARFIQHIPKNKTIVVESGIETHDEIMLYESMGVHAYLIGSTLMRSKDIALKLHDLLGKKSSNLIEGNS